MEYLKAHIAWLVLKWKLNQPRNKLDLINLFKIEARNYNNNNGGIFFFFILHEHREPQIE